MLPEPDQQGFPAINASATRGQAVASYLAYRRAGGESQANAVPLYALVAQAIEQGTTTVELQLLLERLGAK